MARNKNHLLFQNKNLSTQTHTHTHPEQLKCFLHVCSGHLLELDVWRDVVKMNHGCMTQTHSGHQPALAEKSTLFANRRHDQIPSYKNTSYQMPAWQKGKSLLIPTYMCQCKILTVYINNKRPARQPHSSFDHERKKCKLKKVSFNLSH